MPPRRHLGRFWTAALLLAWLFDQLFWSQAVGLNFSLWVFLAILGLFVTAFLAGKRPALPSYLLAAAVQTLALTHLLRNEPFSRGLSTLLSLGGLGLLAATFLNGHWLFYRLGDHLVTWAKLFAAVIVRGSGGTVAARPLPVAPLSTTTAPSADTSTQSTDPSSPPSAQPAVPDSPSLRKNLTRSLPFLRGVLLALPILLVLGSLLAAADPVFNDYMRRLLSVFDFARLPEYLFRLFYISIFAYIFTGVFLHAALPDSDENRPDPNHPWNTRFLGSTEAFIILGAVLALFAFFLLLQFRYLFGGQANITETGFTYSDYARRGFFELVWVAVLSLGLYVALGAFTRRPTPGAQRTFSVLSMLLFTLVLFLLASALQRLMLYEAAYGFTRLRIYTHIFIPWLALVLLAAILLEGLRRPGHLGLALLLTVLGFGLSFTFLNIDGLIASLNLRRAQTGHELDINHLTQLSSDAVPVLAQAFHAQRDPALRDSLGAALACHWILNGAGNPYRPDWRAYNLSSDRAARELATLDLKSYLKPSDQGIYGWTVIYNRQEISCYPPGWD